MQLMVARQRAGRYQISFRFSDTLLLYKYFILLYIMEHQLYLTPNLCQVIRINIFHALQIIFTDNNLNR